MRPRLADWPDKVRTPKAPMACRYPQILQVTVYIVGVFHMHAACASTCTDLQVSVYFSWSHGFLIRSRYLRQFSTSYLTTYWTTDRYLQTGQTINLQHIWPAKIPILLATISIVRRIWLLRNNGLKYKRSRWDCDDFYKTLESGGGMIFTKNT